MSFSAYFCNGPFARGAIVEKKRDFSSSVSVEPLKRKGFSGRIKLPWNSLLRAGCRTQ